MALSAEALAVAADVVELFEVAGGAGTALGVAAGDVLVFCVGAYCGVGCITMLELPCAP